MGELAFLAASRTAITVDDEVTLTAGIAKPFSWANLKIRRTSSPLSSISCELEENRSCPTGNLHDNASLSTEYFRSAHLCVLSMIVVEDGKSGGLRRRLIWPHPNRSSVSGLLSGP